MIINNEFGLVGATKSYINILNSIDNDGNIVEKNEN